MKGNMKTLIYNGKIIINGQQSLDKGYVMFDATGIIATGEGDGPNDIDDTQLTRIDAQGQWVTPGLVDIHNHGALGIEFNTANNEQMNLIAQSMIEEGVTAFLASTTVGTVERMAEMAEDLGGYTYQDGAVCLGIHMEGPYLSEKYKAVMRLEFLRDADLTEWQSWKELSGGFLKAITIAPERAGALEYIKAVSKDVVIMLGHTDASVDCVRQAALYGAKGFTHFYNAMSQHLHREPGVVTAGFLEDDLFCELICDGIHSDVEVVRMTMKALTPKRIILITDAMAGKGMADGRFFFCDHWIIKKDGKAYMEDQDRIAGSVMPLNDMCLNVMDWCQISINDVVQMACINPCFLLEESRRGQLKSGYHSDIVIFNEKLRPQRVFVGGIAKK